MHLHHITVHVSAAQGTLLKTGRKGCKSQNTRKSAINSFCVNKAGIMAPSMDTLQKKGSFSRGPTPRQRTTGD